LTSAASKMQNFHTEFVKKLGGKFGVSICQKTVLFNKGQHIPSVSKNAMKNSLQLIPLNTRLSKKKSIHIHLAFSNDHVNDNILLLPSL
jgi:hypothetical protein